MKIPNPWPHHPHIRCEIRMESGEEVVTVLPSGQELDFPDGALEAKLDAVDKGRSDAKSLATKMWARELGGVMDVADLLAKKALEAEKAEAAKRRKDEAAKKAKDAKMATERIEAVISEKPTIAVSEKPARKMSE